MREAHAQLKHAGAYATQTRRRLRNSNTPAPTQPKHAGAYATQTRKAMSACQHTLLGLTCGAHDAATLEKAYRARSKELHPDRRYGEDTNVAVAEFQEMRRAYDHLREHGMCDRALGQISEVDAHALSVVIERSLTGRNDTLRDLLADIRRMREEVESQARGEVSASPVAPPAVPDAARRSRAAAGGRATDAGATEPPPARRGDRAAARRAGGGATGAAQARPGRRDGPAAPRGGRATDAGGDRAAARRAGRAGHAAPRPARHRRRRRPSRRPPRRSPTAWRERRTTSRRGPCGPRARSTSTRATS